MSVGAAHRDGHLLTLSRRIASPIIVPVAGEIEQVGDSWTTAEGSFNGLPTFIRLREQVEPALNSGRFGHRLVVSRSYTGNAHGLPVGEIGSQLSHVEELLVEYVEDAGLGLLAIVYTNSNAREWTFYVTDPGVGDAVKARIRFSDTLRLQVIDDPGWSEYLSARGGLGAGA